MTGSRKTVESIRHKDRRANIPTRELQGFLAEEEGQPEYLLYPRDPSLDPQLVWKGKDAQDQAGLEVPAVPIYIQEKIHPQAIVEDLRAATAGRAPPVADLFSDFNGIAFQEQVEFYKHEQNWSNRMILGDSLLVMASLAEKENLKGKVQTIYMDPPYGIRFGSNWQVSTRKRGVTDGKAEDATREPEVIRAFRDTWALGVHSYLTYLRDRFTIARDLLSESGSIFVQIGNDNVHLVRSVLDEIFGSENIVVTIIVKKKGAQKSNFIDPVNDYILWYAKSIRDDENSKVKFYPIFESRSTNEDDISEFRSVELELDNYTQLSAVPVRTAGEGNYKARDLRSSLSTLFENYPDARLFRPWPITNGGDRRFQNAPVKFNGRDIPPPKGNCWRHTSISEDDSTPGMTRVAMAGRLMSTGESLDFRRYLNDFGYKTISNWWDGLGGASKQVYVVQTNLEVVKRCILMTTDPGDLVLDPTCGSGTTAYVAEQWGRRWITIDTSRVALALARTRLMAGRYPYYLLADSDEGVRKEAELTGQVPPPHQTSRDIRKGFVCRRVPHITSGAIANNPEIDTIHAKWQPQQDALRQRLQAAAKATFAEWEVPRAAPGGWPAKATALLAEWWDMRRARHAEMDAAILRHADSETLFDQPYEDARRIRVSGPFTVESLSPHRIMPAAEVEDQMPGAAERRDAGQFVNLLIDHLRKAGVQNGRRQERLTFDRLDAYAGTWLQAEGGYTDGAGQARRAAICFGPEFGTVSPELVKEAAKEAVKGEGFDELLVCGFAFDPHCDEEARQYGKLVVLPVKMNPDLAMGDDLLKKTGAGNLFMIFGEPDIAIETGPDGRITVEVKGVDVYDPTTGEIRSHATDDIACWFIDTAYNGESFFVRHAYFTGADRPYERLKKALHAEIDEAAWSTLYATRSRPFDAPKTGRIAVKVINHYGDEVLKIYPVGAAPKKGAGRPGRT